MDKLKVNVNVDLRRKIVNEFPFGNYNISQEAKNVLHKLELGLSQGGRKRGGVRSSKKLGPQVKGPV